MDAEMLENKAETKEKAECTIRPLSHFRVLCGT